MAILSAKPKRGSGGHWYTSGGKAMHTVPTAKGDGVKNTTITEARKYKLFPSVTSILSLFAKPQLNRWKEDRLLRIAYDNPAKMDESFEHFADRCLVEHERPVEEASSFGTRVHDAIEQYYEGKPIEDDLLGYIQPAFDWKQEHQLTFFEREKVLVNHEHGFAGTVDIVGKGPEGQNFIVDWKTKRTDPKKKITPYDFQIHQIAAYGATYFGEDRMMKEGIYGANCYISSTEKGRFHAVSYSPDELRDAWKVFKGVCEIWRSLKNYDPRS